MNVSEEEIFRGKLDSKGRLVVPKEIRDQWQVSGGDRVEVAVVGAESGGYECEECKEQFPLPEVIVLNDGKRVVCASCSGVEDRVI